jgi:hypothetical protein
MATFPINNLVLVSCQGVARLDTDPPAEWNRHVLLADVVQNGPEMIGQVFAGHLTCEGRSAVVPYIQILARDEFPPPWKNCPLFRSD